MWCELSQVSVLAGWLRSCGRVHLNLLEILTRLLSPGMQANFFDEYQMEGVNAENNEICLEVTVENLARSLKTIQAAKSVKVKLTKKHCPCLTIAAELVRSGTAAFVGCLFSSPFNYVDILKKKQQEVCTPEPRYLVHLLLLVVYLNASVHPKYETCCQVTWTVLRIMVVQDGS